MDIDHWEQMKEGLCKKFAVEEEGQEDILVDTADGQVNNGTADFLVVQKPVGRVELAFEKKPLVLVKKEHFSHRAGQAARVEWQKSDTEFTYKLHAYKWNDIDEEWDEIDAEHFG